MLCAQMHSLWKKVFLYCKRVHTTYYHFDLDGDDYYYGDEDDDDDAEEKWKDDNKNWIYPFK